MLKSQKLIVHGALIGAFCFAAQQSAQATLSYTISNGYVGGATESGYADLQVVNISLDNSGPMSVFCGGIQISEAGAPVAGMPTQYTTVCTDLNATLYLGDTYTYNRTASFSGLAGIDPTWGAANGLQAASINAQNATQSIENAAYIFYNFGQLNTRGINGSADQMAGLQLAVWLALYDTTTSGQVVVGGSSRMQISGNGGDTAAVTDALDYLSALNQSGHAGNFSYDGGILVPNPETSDNGSPYNNSNYDNQPPQELLVAVPEPSTFVGGALSLMPLGLAGLRFIRTRATAK